MQGNQRSEARPNAARDHCGWRVASCIVALAIGLVALPCTSALAQPTMLDPTVTQEAADFYGIRACAVTTGGGVKCWGVGVGDGSSVVQSTPKDATGLSVGVATIALGGHHVCVVTTGGGAKCFGNNDAGQLGTGTKIGSLTIVDVLGLGRGVASIMTGGQHTCALTTAGAVKCWGRGDQGQLGIGTMTGSLTAADVPGLSGGVTSVSGGTDHTCALTIAGAVKCWGDNRFGQLGDGSFTTRSLPVDVLGLNGGVVSISAGSGLDHTCALMAARTVKCWGRNGGGELGDGTTADRSYPVDVPGLSGVGMISAGNGKTCAVSGTGGVKCWGYSFGFTPADVLGGLDVKSISVGINICALTASGGVKCWGGNEFGALGNGAQPAGSAFVNVSGLAHGLLDLSAGEGHTCAVTSAGGAKCWGFNGDGQLGDSSEIDRQSPTDVLSLNVRVMRIAAGGFHTCALRVGGGVRCWGQNTFGQLGDGSTAKRSWANDVSGLTSGVAGVSAGSIHTCVLTSAGGVKCWGANSSGQIGDGTTIDRTVPTEVPGLTSGVLSISTGRYHTCAQMIGGSLKCWGSNIFGQLGDGTTTNRVAPTDVTGLSSGVVSINVGANHTCAHLAGGSVKCWGYNAGGALGDGTTQDRWTPVDVSDLSGGVVSLSGGLFHTCAVRSSGGAKCWGHSQSGQLGNGVYGLFPTPVDVLGLTSGVASIHAGLLHTCALMTDGGLRCWGNNGNGRLGDGTTIPSPAPVALFLGQKIAFVPPAVIPIGVSTALSATASSGLPVTFDTWTPGTCSVSGDTVTARAFALCGIRASQAGDIHNAAAPQQLSLIAVAGAPAVTTLAATSVTDSTATLNATVDGNGLATVPSFQYGLTNTYGTGSLGPGTAEGFISMGISNLDCNTLYHFRARATNSAGTTYGNDVTFTTLPCPPPPDAITMPVTSITQTGATLNGTVNPNNAIASSWFEYGLTTAYDGGSFYHPIGGGGAAVPVSFLVTGLTCNTTYHYRVRGKNSGGIGDGLDATFTTAACPPAGLGNIYASSARSIALNSSSRDSLSTVRTEVWYRTRLFAGRSYQLSAWTVDEDGALGVSPVSLSLFSDAAGTVAATPPPTVASGAAEGVSNDSATFGRSLLFRPDTTGVYLIRIQGSPAVTDTSLNVLVRETTLFSPWTSLAAGFEGFVEMHNNTSAPVSVTLRAYDGAGLLQGAGLTFTIPANATVFRTAAAVGVPADVFAGIVLTHNGTVGAVSANITTLNGANGLSFDSPFTHREAGVLGRPVR